MYILTSKLKPDKIIKKSKFYWNITIILVSINLRKKYVWFMNRIIVDLFDV